MPRFEDNPNDLRETIVAAAKAHEEPATPPDEEDDGALDSSVTPETPAGESEAPPESKEKTPSEAEVPPEDGTPAPTTPAERTPAPAPVPTEVSSSDPTARPPGTWTPAAREKWAKVDPDVRQEIWRREREASRAMTISADSRKFSQEFEKAVQPYMGFIAAERATPLQAFSSLMQSGAILRVGTQQQKVELVADTIRRYGVDLNMLDSMLAGSPVNNENARLEQMVQQSLAPIQQKLQRFEQMESESERAQNAAINDEINAFSRDPKNEFWPDVEHIIPDILEVAARQGQQMSLTQAYQRAILMHEPVRQVIESRQRNVALRNKAAAATRARNAGSSITPSSQVNSVNAAPAPGDNIRADIEAAIAAQQGR